MQWIGNPMLSDAGAIGEFCREFHPGRDWLWRDSFNGLFGVCGVDVRYRIYPRKDAWVIEWPDPPLTPGDGAFTVGDQPAAADPVNHPPHYGGDTPYEAIKVIRAWGLGFALGNAVKYLCRAGKKGDRLEDLRKARFYLDDEIKQAEAAAK